jgi:hypothetical protein
MVKPMPARPDSTNDAAGLPADVIARAEAALKGLVAEYERRAAQDVARLKTLLAELKAGTDAPSSWEPFHRIAHDMKGQGGTFDYGLVSEIADRFCGFLKRTPPSRQAAGPIGAFIEALATVLNTRLTGNGGEAGAAILASIRMQRE